MRTLDWHHLTVQVTVKVCKGMKPCNITAVSNAIEQSSTQTVAHKNRRGGGTPTTERDGDRITSHIMSYALAAPHHLYLHGPK